MFVTTMEECPVLEFLECPGANDCISANSTGVAREYRKC